VAGRGLVLLVDQKAAFDELAPGKVNENASCL
jgi:hypothetical protein